MAGIARSILISILLFCLGCGPSISRMGYTPDPVSKGLFCTPKIVRHGVFSPETSRLLGTAKVKGGGDTCSRDDILRMLTQDACAAGANYVNIVFETKSGGGNSCYSATVEMIRSDQKNISGKIEHADMYPEEDKQIEADKKASGKLAAGIIIGLLVSVGVGVLVGLAASN